MEFMTEEERKDLTWARNAKMVRLGVYDAGIVITAAILATQGQKFHP